MASVIFFHVDIDAFFASVEQLDNPSLVGRPVIVGARPGGRGVVSTCSYEARAFGVRSAMPIQEAFRLCPGGAFLPVRMQRYLEKSAEVFGVFSHYCPEPQALSIDEAFLDMSGTERLFGPPAQAARSLKADVRTASGLTISVGIGPNRFLAKLASARSKPDGLLEVAPGGEESFLDALPLASLWGAGDKTQERLRELNIRDMASLRSIERETLWRLMGRGCGEFLYLACRGIDPGFFTAAPQSRSVSCERTFERDINDEDILESVLLELCQEAMRSLHAKGQLSDCLAVKLRYGDFSTVRIQEKQARPLSSVDEAFRLASRLFRVKWVPSRPLRLLGVSMSVQDPGAGTQGELFDDQVARREVDRAVFDMEKRGRGGMRKARSIRRRGEGP